MTDEPTRSGGQVTVRHVVGEDFTFTFDGEAGTYRRWMNEIVDAEYVVRLTLFDGRQFDVALRDMGYEAGDVETVYYVDHNDDVTDEPDPDKPEVMHSIPFEQIARVHIY